MKVLETERLLLRQLTLGDAAFIRRLVNEPSWLQFIGDRGVKTEEDARGYLRNGPLAMYDRYGFGLFAVELAGGGGAIGICGLLKRDFLDDVDLGFAFFPEYWGMGYAREAAAGVLDLAQGALGLRRVVAITAPDNHRSTRLLEKIGFEFEKTVKYPGNASEVLLYSRGR